MRRTTVFIAVLWGMGLANCHAGENWPSIGQGINLDFSTTQVNKVEYDPGFYETFQAAGFDSVRFFVKTGITEPMQYKAAIDDALKRGLTVVLAGFTGKNHGKEAFVEFWRDFAEFYQMYPKELVFEIMNEPSQGGHPNDEESAAITMNWLSAAIVAIRDSSPTRVIAIGGPGYNPVDALLKYVTPKYLDYELPDGTGFEEDENIWGIFHHYKPHKWSHSRETVSLAEVNPNRTAPLFAFE